jgi:uncharacterized protein YjdB
MISPKSATLHVPAPNGENAPGFVSTQQFHATVVMSYGPAHGDVTWSSSDPSLAEVTLGGLLTARKAGTVTLSATTQGSTKRAIATVTILAEGQVHVIVK